MNFQRLEYLDLEISHHRKQKLNLTERIKISCKLEELDNFDINITVISFIDLMKKLVLGVDEKDDVIKQIKIIRNLEQLKICDLRYFDEYANYFYKYWSEIGRPFDEYLLLKFVDKLPGKIREKLHNELINWFKSKRTQEINYYATLLPVIEYVTGRIREYCEEEKHRHQLKLQFRKNVYRHDRSSNIRL